MPLPYLLINDENQANKLEIQGDTFTIGRHELNALTLKDHEASRFHAEIVKKAESWVLRDLKSSNGTRLNGIRIQELALASGDLIEIGTTRLRFMMTKPAATATKAPEAASERTPMPAARTSPPPPPPAAPSPSSPPPGPSVNRAPPENVSSGQDLGAEDRLANMAAALPITFVANDIVILSSRGEVSLPPVLGNRRAAPNTDPVAIFRLLLLVSTASGASDIHIEPREKTATIRLRVDGNMVEASTMPRELSTRLLSMLKVLADLDIAQRSVIQEGNFSARMPPLQSAPGAEFRRVDYRMSFAPSVHGQKLVVRVQDNANAPSVIDQLQLTPYMLEELRLAMDRDSGMVLVTGPTGSGKTTTLYALLRSIDVSQRNIVTIENPVEIQIPGITQMPVDESQGKGFSELLRSVLRQDPDVILVGEIRDEETARTAMRAAITGHLVLSTLHTKDALGTIYRLLDLGVEPFLLSQGLSTILAQRLVRQLCSVCKKPVAPTAEQQRRLGQVGITADVICAPVGCERCFGTGHAGRRAVCELLTTTEELRTAIARKADLGDIAAAASIPTKLLQAGYQLVADGVADFQEVERIVGR